MSLDLLTISVVLILALLTGGINKRTSRILYIYISAFILLLFVSMRSIWVGTDEIGADTPNYYRMFKNVQTLSWPYIFKGFFARYIYHTTEFEFGYVILQKLISYITTNWWIFTFIINLLFFVPFVMLLDKNLHRTKDILFVFLFYIVFLQRFMMCAGRQNYAIGLCILSFLYIQKYSIKKAVFFILLASLIHTSAIVFLLVIFFISLEPKTIKKVHLLIFIAVPFIALFGKKMISIAGLFLGLQKYENYAQAESSSIVFPLMLLIITFLCYKYVSIKMIIADNNLKSIYIMAVLVTLFAPFSFLSQGLVRVASYFTIYIGLLIPKIIKENSSDLKTEQIISFVTVLILVIGNLIIYKGGLEYKFFWEETQLIDDGFYHLLDF